jgi:hypothetical protein
VTHPIDRPWPVRIEKAADRPTLMAVEGDVAQGDRTAVGNRSEDRVHDVGAKLAGAAVAAVVMTMREPCGVPQLVQQDDGTVDAGDPAPVE